MDMGEKIKALREERGISQEALAEALDVSRQAVTKWECGLSRPSTGNLLALCRVLEVPLETFTGAPSEPAPEPPKKRTFPLWVLWILSLLCISLAAICLFTGQNDFPATAIGGADAPTAIYVTAAANQPLLWSLTLAGLLLLCLTTLLTIRRRKKRS